MLQNCLYHFSRTKKTFLVLGLVLALGKGSEAFAICEPTTNPDFDQYSKGKYSYECNVQNICLGKGYGGDYWDFNTDKKLIILHDKTKYPNLVEDGISKSITDIREIYHNTQNNIMNCAILKSKYALHEKIIKDYKISEKAIEVLKKANDIIIKQIAEEKCEPPRGGGGGTDSSSSTTPSGDAGNDETGDKIYLYKDLLDSMTYEQCEYNMYLWYYENVCKKNNYVCIGDTKPYTAYEIMSVLQTQINIVQGEYDLSKRTMATALSLYDNFEKTYIAHVLLEMIEAELTEDKRFLGTTWKAIQQWLSLARNAQKNESDR